MIKGLVKLMNDWFFERRSKESMVNTFVDKKLEQRYQKARHLSVSQCSENIFSVRNSSSDYLVDLARKKCSCYMFQQLQIPCFHALAACTTIEKNAKDLVMGFYYLTNYSLTYARIFQLPPFQITEGYEQHINPPVMVTRARRLRVRRIRRQAITMPPSRQ
jgi:hypothetical protein